MALNVKFEQTRQPVTSLAYASSAPECPGSSTWCYAFKCVALALILLALSLSAKGTVEFVIVDPISIERIDGRWVFEFVHKGADQLLDTVGCQGTPSVLVQTRRELHIRNRHPEQGHPQRNTGKRLLCFSIGIWPKSSPIRPKSSGS